MNNKFSILTANYNNKKYLNDYFNSILAQKYRPLEVVFIDDSSNDGSIDKVNQLFKEFDKENITYKIESLQNRVYCSSANKQALELATGDFFGTLDSDDMLTPDAVDFIMDLYNKYEDAGYIYTQFQIHDQLMNPKSKGWSSCPKNNQSLLSIGRQRKHGLSHWRTFSRRVPNLHKLWKDGLKSGVDKYFAYRIETMAKGYFVNKVCYKYRWGHKNAISKTEKAIDSWNKIMADEENRRVKYNLKPIKIEEIKEF